MKVLIVEDDMLCADNIATYLKKSGIFSDLCYSGKEACHLVKNFNYDSILVDLNLPDISGNQVIKLIRNLANKHKSNTPIITISSDIIQENKIKSFIEGTDDFLIKPFDMRELILRIRSKICRQRGIPSSIVNIGEMTVNLDKQLVFINDKQVHLTKKEYQFIEILVLRLGSKVSKTTLFENLYPDCFDGPTKKIIDVIKCKTNKKIAKYTPHNYISTVWGEGYEILNPQEQKAHVENTIEIKTNDDNKDQDNLNNGKTSVFHQI